MVTINQIIRYQFDTLLCHSHQIDTLLCNWKIHEKNISSVVKVFTDCDSLQVLDMSVEDCYNKFSVATTTLIVNDIS